MELEQIKKYKFSSVFLIFILGSLTFDYTPGIKIYDNFFEFLATMMKFIPIVFLLIGLFEVWVDKETIEYHLGHDSGVIAFIWAILLAGTTIGGLYVAFPIAYSLYNKGARLAVIFSYLGAAAVARIPMTLFEASFLGVKFSVVRIIISIPLIIISSIGLEKYLANKEFVINNPSNQNN